MGINGRWGCHRLPEPGNNGQLRVDRVHALLTASMKNLSLITSAVFLVLAIGACGDDDGGQAEPKTIADHVRTDDRLASLKERLELTDQLAALDGAGPFTLFAPRNDAFAPLATPLNDSAAAQLADLLSYHIHDGERSASQLERTTALATQFGPELHVRFGLDGILLNDGVKLVSEEIVTDNGIIHIVDAVLVRPLVTTTKRHELSPDISFGETFEILDSTITVDDVGFIHNLRVFVDIEHTNLSSLFVTLETSSGEIPLLQAPPTYAKDFQVSLADSAPLDLVNDVVRTDDPEAQAFTGTAYRPIQPFEFQLGAPSEGTWTLRVYNFNDGEVGRIVRWGIDLTSGTEPPAPAIAVDTRYVSGANPTALGRGFNESFKGNFRRVGGLTGELELSATAGELSSSTRTLEQDRSLGAVVMPVPDDEPLGPRVAHVIAQSSTGVSRIVPLDVSVAEPEASNLEMLSHVPLPDLGSEVRPGNDIWGWTDPMTGAEIAIVGTAMGTAFVDISVPTAPVVLGTLPTQTVPSTWRDVKVYENHAFIVSEAREHGLQVFDLTQLRSVSSPPQTFSASAHSGMFGSAHNIAINEDTGYAYILGSDFSKGCAGGVLSYDIVNPLAPVQVGCFAGGVPAGASPGDEYPTDVYVHDAQCVTYAGPDTDHVGREICVTSDASTIGIADVTDHANVAQLSRVTYPEAGYVHQGWLTEDHRYIILNDEFDEFEGDHDTRSYVWDMTDLDAPVLLGSFDNPRDAIGHNTYVLGDVAFQANYTSGLRLVDLGAIDTGTATEMAYYDTYPDDDSTASSMASCSGNSESSLCGTGTAKRSFQGAWSNYPFFASGNIVVSDTERGLFVLRRTP